MSYPANLDTIVVRHKIVDTGGKPLKGNSVRAVATKRIWATDGSLIPFETTARVQADGTYEFELPYVDQDGIHNKGVPFQIIEDVPGKPRHYFIAPVLAHGAGPIDATEALVEAPVGYEVKIQAGPVTDAAAAQLLDQDGQFKAALTGTIATQTEPIARAVGEDAAIDILSRQPEVTDAAATRAVSVSSDAAMAGNVTNLGSATAAVVPIGRTVTPTTPDLQTVLNSAAALGAPVYFVGAFTLNAALQVPNGAVWDGHAATLKMAAGRPALTPCLSLNETVGATLRGFTLDGNRANQSATGHQDAGHHGIRTYGAIDCTFTDILIKDFWTDGIYLRGTGSDGSTGGAPSRNLTFTRVRSVNNARQGASVINAEDVIFNYCTFADTNGKLPGAGVDIEPNNIAEVPRRITFNHCMFTGNAGNGLFVLVRENGAHDITVSHSTFAGNGSAFLRISRHAAAATSTVTGLLVEHSHVGPGESTIGQADVTFDDFTLRNVVFDQHRLTFNNSRGVTLDTCTWNSQGTTFNGSLVFTGTCTDINIRNPTIRGGTNGIRLSTNTGVSTRMKLEGGLVEGCTNDGIVGIQTLVDPHIVDVKVRGCGRYGLTLNSTSGMQLRGNDVKGSTTADYRLTNTVTDSVIALNQGAVVDFTGLPTSSNRRVGNTFDPVA